jgi:hypothetical protein
MVEITNPVVQGADLIYSYKILNGTMPATGGPAALFIDWIGIGGVGRGFHGIGSDVNSIGVVVGLLEAAKSRSHKIGQRRLL